MAGSPIALAAAVIDGKIASPTFTGLHFDFAGSGGRSLKGLSRYQKSFPAARPPVFSEKWIAASEILKNAAAAAIDPKVDPSFPGSAITRTGDPPRIYSLGQNAFGGFGHSAGTASVTASAVIQSGLRLQVLMGIKLHPRHCNIRNHPIKQTTDINHPADMQAGHPLAELVGKLLQGKWRGKWWSSTIESMQIQSTLKYPVVCAMFGAMCGFFS